MANVNGTYSAMDNVCLHRGGPLGQGMIEGGKVVCPGTAGSGTQRPARPRRIPEPKVAVYPLKIEGGDVLVEI